MAKARIRVQQLEDAAAALLRAAEAARRMATYPHFENSPCPHQWQAAVAEIQAAIALIEKAQEPAPDFP